MRIRYSLLLLALLITSLLPAQINEEELSVHAFFEPNMGQWDGDFNQKIALSNGALFLQDGGYTVNVLDAEKIADLYHGGHTDEGESSHAHPITPYNKIPSLGYRVKYLNSLQPTTEYLYPFAFHRNYFKGKDQSKWASEVPLYGAVKLKDFYQQIDLQYYSKNDFLKYDFIVHPGGNPRDIQWMVDGTNIEVIEGELHYKAPFGDVVEKKPVVYQNIGGRKIYIDARYQIVNGVASFDIDDYNPSYDLIIDPVLVFSSYSASRADNWGFTATHDITGGLYGGGITFGTGYPTSTGVFDPTYNNGPQSNTFYVDATISKFDPTGTNLLYATYLGGSECDQPHSMVVNSSGQLVVFGATGSNNFPTTTNAPYSTFSGGPATYPHGGSAGSSAYDFPIGTDAFVSVFSPNGSTLVGSTYLGGSGRDGINSSIERNYGDASRGEVIVDDQDNILVVTTTFSSDFPRVNSNVNGLAGSCDAAIVKLNSNASGVIWSTTYGGAGADQGYGIKVAPNGNIFITGGTNSNNLPSANGLNGSYSGNTDGYIARFNPDGSLNTTTYLGTGTYDQSFLIDIDKNNAVYVFGQTSGSYPRTSGAWTSGSSRQFIHKLSNDLTTTLFSTFFGSSTHTRANLVPTAFNVDDCLNILLSGWGGQVNAGPGHLSGSVTGLPISSDAYQSSTDGSDFYFMSLEANATGLTYATFFGGRGLSEHVDGGTSRFSHSGEIYQAVCAGCGGSDNFPTTGGAYSRVNRSNNCNLGVIKFDFEVSVEAAADINYTTDVDTVCNTLTVKFTNESKNANVFIWDFGNSRSSRSKDPATAYTQFGTYTVQLIAIDTICDISDTAYLTIEHTKGIEPSADFDAEYTSCDATRNVYLTNYSKRVTNFVWDMGNGVQLTGNPSSYSYPVEGNYTITLFAYDTVCGKIDTATQTVNFITDIDAPVVHLTPSDCKNGKIDVWYENDSSYYQYTWTWVDGSVDHSKYPNSKAPFTGTQLLKLTINDPVCNSIWHYTFTVDITRLDNRVYIPNSFSPNGDGVNDVFILKGNTCLDGTSFMIYNRWGQKVFETDKPFSIFWDGRSNDGTIKEDTYVYVFNSEDGERKGFVTILP